MTRSKVPVFRGGKIGAPVPIHFDKPPVVVHRLAVPGSPLRFEVREEGPDFVITFAGKRIHYLRTMAKAERAVGLWDRLMRTRMARRRRLNPK